MRRKEEENLGQCQAECLIKVRSNASANIGANVKPYLLAQGLYLKSQKQTK